MTDKFYNPLLDKYLGPKELESFKEKKDIKNLFDESTKSVESAKTPLKTESAKSYSELTKGLRLEKILVGPHDKKPFFALVDTKERVCVPLVYS